MKHNNEVIIIGGNHHNMLGVIRAFGEKGKLVNIIITSKHKYCYIKKRSLINLLNFFLNLIFKTS